MNTAGILWILPLLQWKIKILFLQEACSGFYLYCNGKFKFYFYNLKKIKLEIWLVSTRTRCEFNIFNFWWL